MASSPTKRPLLPARGTGPTPAGSPRPFWRSRGFWIYLVVLLAINYILTFVFMSGPARITVPYTTFIQQVNADNVKDITAQANSIQGDIRVGQRHALSDRAASVCDRQPRDTARAAQCPDHRDGPRLGRIPAAEHPAEFRAGAAADRWLSLPEPAHVRGGSGRLSGRLRPEQGHAVHTGLRDAHHLCRRGRDRGGQAGPCRSRRFPQDAGKVPAARRADPARHPAGGSAWHRQDLAGSRRRR